MSSNHFLKNFKMPVIIFMGVIVLVVGIFAGYKIFASSDASSNDALNAPQSGENNELPTETRNYITDASYKTGNVKESYYFYEELVKVSDIVVPYLNIDAPAAEKINNEIKALYDDFIGMYNDFSQEGLSLERDSTESYDYIKSKYSYTLHNDVLSILITVSRTGRGSSVAEEYYAFNYDIKENKPLFLDELCKKYGIVYEDAIKKVNEKLETSFDEKYDFVDYPSLELRQESDEYIKLNKEYFVNQIKNKKENVYIDEMHRLNIIVLNEHPFGGCGFYSDFVVF